MFQFTTQTILNSVALAPSTASVTVTKAQKVSDYDKANVIINESGRYPQLRVGNVRFNWPDILDVYYKKATPEILSYVTFDLSKLSTLVDNPVGFWRVALYVRLNNRSADSFYSNATSFFGHPFYIEFPVKENDTPANIAQRIKNIADKYMLLQTEEKLIDIEIDGTKIKFKGTTGYQYFHVAKIQYWDDKAIAVDCCANQGDFIDVITGVPVKYTVADGEVTETEVVAATGENLADNEAPIVNGTEAFGDYNWIIHNLRLPSPANTDWWTGDKNEMPVVGATYDQFIVRLIKERDGIAGGILGQRATTVTTHVFYVNTEFAADFKAILEGAVGEGNIRDYIDGMLDDPFKTTNSANYVAQTPYKTGPVIPAHDEEKVPYATSEEEAGGGGNNGGGHG